MEEKEVKEVVEEKKPTIAELQSQYNDLCGKLGDLIYRARCIRGDADALQHDSELVMQQMVKVNEAAKALKEVDSGKTA